MKKLIFLFIVFSVTYLSCHQAIEHCGNPTNIIQCESPVLNDVENLDQVKKEIKKFEKSGKWNSSNECVVEKAKAILEQYLPVYDKKLALVFDIDETALSNWFYMEKNDFGYVRNRFKTWEISAQAAAIEPVLDLYRFGLENGFAIFFISGRNEYQREATALNLQRAGFTSWNGLFLKPLNFKGASVCIFKSQWRKHIQEMGYTIIANIGDQISDIAGEPQALYNFKLANPAYVIP